MEKVSKKKILQELENRILSPVPGKIEKAFPEPGKDMPSSEAVLKAFTRGIEKAREQFITGERSIPELLLSVDAFRSGVRFLKRLVPAKGTGQRGQGVVIGVVQGDVHDMGKNIVAGILEASGYPVHDAGRDVPREAFLELIEKTGAPVLALSSMMSTPLENMKDVITWVRKLHPSTAVLVGGAALDEDLARSLGADGYTENAAKVPEEIRRVLGKRKPRRRAQAG